MTPRTGHPGGIRALSARLALAAIGLLLLPWPMARAQAVDVQLKEESTNSPLPGAVVALLRDTTTAVLGLTNASGHVLLRAPSSGSFRLRVVRIGYRPMLTEPFTIEPAATVRKASPWRRRASCCPPWT